MDKLIPEDVLRARCPSGNVVFDYSTGDVICADTGEVLGEGMPAEIPESPILSAPPAEVEGAGKRGASGPRIRVRETAERYVIEYIKAGLKPREIAARLGLPLKRAYYIIEKVRKEGGFPNPYRVDEETARAVRRDYNAGVPVREICRKYGIARDTLYRIVGERRRRGRVSLTKAEAIRRDYNAGMPVREICRKYGISSRTLYRIVGRRRINRRRKKKVEVQ